MKKIDMTLSNFEMGLKQLENFLAKPVEDERDEAGIIQAFEFSFELCWKALQKIGQREGIDIGSPRKAFQFALQAEFIPSSDEQAWLQMLTDRNLTTHAYDKPIAKQIFERVKSQHAENLRKLLDRLFKP